MLGVVVSPDGRWIASAGDMTVRVFRADTGEQQKVLYGHADAVLGVAVSPDGRRLASTAQDRTVRIWDFETGKEVHLLRGHEEAPARVTLSPDGRRLASACNDDTVRVWDVEDGRELFVLRHGLNVWNIAWSPYGRCLASGASYGFARLWDLAAVERVLDPKTPAEVLLAETEAATGLRLEGLEVVPVPHKDLVPAQGAKRRPRRLRSGSVPRTRRCRRRSGMVLFPRNQEERS